MTDDFRTRSRHYFAYLALITIFLVGEGLFIFGIHILKLDNDPGHWAKAEGIVKRSLLAYDGETYGVDLLYTFRANGVTNTGYRVTLFDCRSFSPSNAVETLKLFPKGAEVTVNYRMNDPSICVLSREEKAPPWYAAGSGAAVMLIALIGIIRENRR